MAEQSPPSSDEKVDRIANFYAGKTILISGGTGFVGKVFIEKILRVCPNVGRIYMLVRTKKGKDPNERLKDIFASPLYNKLKDLHGPEIVQKCTAVAGDVGELELGLSPKDRETLKDTVEIIYHCAATIRFDDPLKKAVLINVRGTKQMLELAKECKKLLVFCHMSTAYCHLKERILLEKMYPPPADPHHVIKSVEWLDEQIVDSITDKILGDLPNTYAFTKALGEGLVMEYMKDIPSIILRPSVVIPIWKEPLPGWTDNINGPTGLLIGAGKGVIRTMYCNQNGYADLIPVDVVANGMLLAPFDFIVHEGVRQVYHITASSEVKITYEEIIELGRKIIENKVPLNGVVWYPGGSMKKSRLAHNIATVLYHIIPAIIIDCLLFLLGYKPVLCRVQRRISKGFEVFEYYANNQWDFENQQVYFGRDYLNPYERSIYKIDSDGLDYEEYFTDCLYGARRYILKETDDTIPAAKLHMKIMWFVDKITKLLMLFGFLYLIYHNIVAPVLGL